MTDDQFRQLRDDIANVRVSVAEVHGRIAAVEAKVDSKAERADVFRNVLLVNGGFIAVISVGAMALRTFDVV